MFEEKTYEYLMDKKLEIVRDDVDKREGSIIYDAMAPNSAEAAAIYAQMDMLINRTFADTATGSDLDKRTAERNIKRYSATRSIVKGEFKDSNSEYMDIELGTRFSGDEYDYTVYEKISTGIYKLSCDDYGSKGNRYIGQLIPISFINGFGNGKITEVLIPGEDKETDKNLRTRYFDSFRTTAFGGNIEDYIIKVNALRGVGKTKVYPVWNGGGTVKIVICDSEYLVPSTALIEEVQNTLDPGMEGLGIGIAPIGHKVSVFGVSERTIDISVEITYAPGYSWEDIQSEMMNELEEYFSELRLNWAEESNVIVRISQIETRILKVVGVIDVGNTKINYNSQNYRLGEDEMPILGQVVRV